ncbi:MAG: glycosyltransferase family 2 protein [Deltaproteobacteria bacterium]|nr:glycosyltransferase family 2 protein [Deltaproteobacteria bacterium]
MTSSDLAVVIPAYNAEDTLTRVVDRIFQVDVSTLRRIWIVDDGSLDATSAVAAKLGASDARISLLSLRKNRGYGAAMKRGLLACREEGASMVACVHADGQYAPEVLPDLVASLQERRLDLIQGSRIASGTALSGGMPLYKYLGNRGLTGLENFVFGLSMTDYHSGYLVYGAEALASLPFESFSDSFDFDLEVLACSHARGLRLGESPIPTHYGDERSHLRSIPYGLRALRVMSKYLLRRYNED